MRSINHPGARSPSERSAGGARGKDRKRQEEGAATREAAWDGGREGNKEASEGASATKACGRASERGRKEGSKGARERNKGRQGKAVAGGAMREGGAGQGRAGERMHGWKKREACCHGRPYIHDIQTLYGM